VTRVKVHVTGGRGFLGRYVTEALEAAYAVEVSDIETLDVNDYEKTAATLAASAPAAVCHVAGVTGAERSLRSPHEFFRTNCFGTLNVLEACRVAGIPRLVFLSSITVHGATDERPVDELSPYRPLHPYAGSKAAAEILVETYARCYGMCAVILRPTIVVGEGQTEENAVSQFVATARRDGDVRVFGDGRHRREWLHAVDLASAVRAAVDQVVHAASPMVEAYIVSSGAPVGMRELAERVIALVGKGRVAGVPATRQAFSLCSDPGKAKGALGWRPTVDIDEIIRRMAATPTGDEVGAP